MIATNSEQTKKPRTSRARNGSGSITQNASGHWQVRYTIPGHGQHRLGVFWAAKVTNTMIRFWVNASIEHEPRIYPVWAHAGQRLDTPVAFGIAVAVRRLRTGLGQ